VALKDVSARHAAVFNNAPVKTHLAILAAFFTAQKNDRITPWQTEGAQWGRSAPQALLRSDPREIKGSSA
jgi:hypothetical protein